MTELTYPWDAYLRLQTELSQKHDIDHRGWALESALNYLLSNPPPPDEVNRSVETAERRERYRAALQRKTLPPAEFVEDHSESVHAKMALDDMRKIVSREDWNILLSLGMGREYSDIARATGENAGQLRVRVMRFRRAMKAYHPEFV